MILLLTFLFQPPNKVKDTLTSEAVRSGPKLADPCPAPAPCLRLVSSVSRGVLSHSVVSSSLRPLGIWSARRLCPWNFSGNITGVGCHFLLQGIFPTQGSNPCLCIAGRFSTAEPSRRLHRTLDLSQRLRRDLLETISLYVTSYDICM